MLKKYLCFLSAIFLSNIVMAQFELLQKFGEIPVNATIADIDCESGLCIFLSAGQLAYSSDAGSTLTYANPPITSLNEINKEVQVLNESTLFVSTLQSNLKWKLSLSSNMGENWLELVNFSGDTLNALSFSMTSIKKGMINCRSGKVIRSSSQFVQSDTLSPSNSNSDIVDLLVLNDSVAALIQDYTFFLSSSSGDAWDSTFKFHHNTNKLNTYLGDKFIVTQEDQNIDSTIFGHSMDVTGNQWNFSRVWSSQSNEIYSKIHFINDSIVLAVGGNVSIGAVLFYSRNSGVSWDTLNIPYFMGQATDIEPVNDSIALIGGMNGTLVRLHIDQLVSNPNDTGDSVTAINSIILTKPEIRVHPNPTSATHCLQLPVNDGEVNIIMYDIHGRQMGSWLSQKVMSGKITRDITSLDPGMYFYVISNGRETWTARFVKQDN